MADPNHPRRFTDDFKRQIADLYNGGKPVGEIMADYDLGRSTVRRWINSINATGSPRAADNRTPGSAAHCRPREGEQAPAHGERRFKTSCADIRTKVTAIAANAGRYPVSAQCEILGVPRSTCCAMRGRAEPVAAPDPAVEEVAAAFEESRGRYGAGKIKASLARMGIVLSRRRIGRIMKDKGLISAYANAKFKPSRSSADEADAPNIVNREFDGRAPRTHVVSDLAYVRVGARWCYVCLLIDLYNREIVGHAAGERKDAGLMKSAFATLSFLLDDIEVFHTDRGPEFNNAAIDELLDVFEIKRSLSAKGCPYDNSVDESTNKILKAEFVYRERFSTLRELQAKLSDYVNWYNNFRLHSTLGYMSVCGSVKVDTSADLIRA